MQLLVKFSWSLAGLFVGVDGSHYLLQHIHSSASKLAWYSLENKHSTCVGIHMNYLQTVYMPFLSLPCFWKFLGFLLFFPFFPLLV